MQLNSCEAASAQVVVVCKSLVAAMQPSMAVSCAEQMLGVASELELERMKAVY